MVGSSDTAAAGASPTHYRREWALLTTALSPRSRVRAPQIGNGGRRKSYIDGEPVAVTSGEGTEVVDPPGAPERIRRPRPRRARGEGIRRDAERCGTARSSCARARSTPWSGENGSGKSTLVKILSGVHVPDAGRVEVAGEQAQLRSPKAAQEHGIVTVFQEVLVAEARSVLDNVWLGVDDTWRTRVPAREKRRRAQGRSGASSSAGRSTCPRADGRAFAQRPAGLLHRAGPAAPAAHPDPRRSDVRARRRHARPALRAGHPPRRRGRRGDLHHSPHGRDRGDRRPHHGHALGRDGRHASSARHVDAARAGAPHDRRRTSSPASAARRRRRPRPAAGRRC